jgi:Leucine-rich repeat (LRR) protein
MRFQSALIVVAVLVASMVIAEDNLDEAKVIQKIELLGGKVTRDDTLPGRPVIGIDFQRSERFSEKYLHLLQSFTRLKSLDLVGIKITETGMAEINKLKQSFPNVKVYYDDPKESVAIEEIEKLKGSVVRNEALPGRLVKSVVLAGLNINDGTVRLLNRFTVLIEVRITQANISDLGLAALSKIKTLRSLNLSAARVTDAGVKEIVGLTQLTHLRLDSCKKITDASLKEIGNLKSLSDLGLGGTQITDVGLRDLRELTNLTGLYLSGTAITDLGLKEMSEFTSLKTLDLADTKVTDEGLKHLVELQNLVALDLMFCKQISDAGLAELCRIKSLTRIRLHGSEVTDAGVNALQECLPNLRISR